MQCQLYMGGTFDPVHNGHIHNARLLAEHFGTAVRLVLAGNPGHRDTPVTSASQRLEMLRLASLQDELLIVDDCELQRPGRTFTLDTLHSLRKDFSAEQPIAWVVGADALSGLHLWKRWDELLQLAHLIVIGRPDASAEIAPEVKQALERAKCDNSQQLHTRAAGYALSLKLADLDISASLVREKLALNQPVEHLLPPGVKEYIDDEKIYTR